METIPFGPRREGEGTWLRFSTAPSLDNLRALHGLAQCLDRDIFQHRHPCNKPPGISADNTRSWNCCATTCGWLFSDGDRATLQGSSITRSRTGEGGRGTQLLAQHRAGDPSRPGPGSAEGFAILSTDKHPEQSADREAAPALMSAGSTKAP